MPYCLSCGSDVWEYDSAYYARNMHCIPCYTRKASEVPMVSCSRCGVRLKNYEAKERHGSWHCTYCFSEENRQAAIPTCPVCGTKVEEWQKPIRAPDGKMLHPSCQEGRKRQAMREFAGRPSQPQGKSAILRLMLGKVSAMLM